MSLVNFDTNYKIENESFKINFDTTMYKVSYEQLLAAHHDLTYTIDKQISKANALIVSTQNQIAQEGILEDVGNKIKELFIAFINKIKEIWNKIVEKVKAFFRRLFAFFKTDSDIDVLSKLAFGKKGMQLSGESETKKTILLWNEALVKSKIKHFPNLLATDTDIIKALNNLAIHIPKVYSEQFYASMTVIYETIEKIFDMRTSEDFGKVKMDSKIDIVKLRSKLDTMKIKDRSGNDTIIVKNGETFNLVIDTDNDGDSSHWYKADLVRNELEPMKDKIEGYDIDTELLQGLLRTIMDKRKANNADANGEYGVISRLSIMLNNVTRSLERSDLEITQLQASSILSFLNVLLNSLPSGLNTTITSGTMEAIKLLKLLRKSTPLVITDIITPDMIFGVGRKPMPGHIAYAYTNATYGGSLQITDALLAEWSKFTFDDLMSNQMRISPENLIEYEKKRATLAGGDITIHYLGKTGNPAIDGNCFAVPGNVMISLPFIDILFNSAKNKEYKFSKDYIKKAITTHELGHVIHFRKLGIKTVGDGSINGIIVEINLWQKTLKQSEVINPMEAFADAYMVKRMGMDKETYLKINNLIGADFTKDDDDNVTITEDGTAEYNNDEGRVRYNLRIDNIFDLASKIEF